VGVLYATKDEGVTDATNTAGVGVKTFVIVELSIAYWDPDITAYVATVKEPASLTESGFVPPTLNTKENAEAPLV